MVTEQNERGINQQKGLSPGCDTENEFYSHVNVSTYKSHSF